MLSICLECHGSYSDGKGCGHKRVFRASSASCGGFLYEKGEIPTSKKERREVARWSSEGKGGERKVYVNCIYCGSVDEVSNHGFVVRDGGAEIRNCIICRKCDRHYWVTLEGWTYGNMSAFYADDEAGEDPDDYEEDGGGDDDDDS